MLLFFFNGLVDDYWYVQELWESWDFDEEFILCWKLIFFLWEINVSGLSEDYYGDCFYPDDNYLYPEFKYYYIFFEQNLDCWF